MNASAAERLAPISEEDYLAGEEQAVRKHEYVDGMVYAMVGGRYNHNLIASNVLAELHSQLKGSPCRALNSGGKLRVQVQSRTRFYYPDVSVVCGDNLRGDFFQDMPSVLVEVLSHSTRRIDEGEKQQAYLQIETLSAYLLLEQDLPAATVFYRVGAKFERHVYDGENSVIELPAINARLCLAAAYAEVVFSPEPDASERT